MSDSMNAVGRRKNALDAQEQREAFYSLETPIALLLEDERFCTGITRAIPSFPQTELIGAGHMSFREMQNHFAAAFPAGMFDAVEMLLYTLAKEQ